MINKASPSAEEVELPGGKLGEALDDEATDVVVGMAATLFNEPPNDDLDALPRFNERDAHCRRRIAWRRCGVFSI